LVGSIAFNVNFLHKKFIPFLYIPLPPEIKLFSNPHSWHLQVKIFAFYRELFRESRFRFSDSLVDEPSGSMQFPIWPILASKTTIVGVKTALFWNDSYYISK
jgi:hypothetical protein